MRAHALSIRPASPTFASDPQAALADYQRRGFHVERGLWSAEARDALVRAARGLPAFADGTLAPVMNPHRLHGTFLRALRHEAVVTVMRQLVGGLVSGLQTQFFYCRPGTPGFTAHQDNFYVEAKPEAFASAWTALEDAGPENGGLFVHPGSHVEAILPVEIVPGARARSGQALNAIRQRAVVPARYPRIELCVPPGAVVFLHGHLVHGSNDNRSNRTRMALLMTYIRRGERFRAGSSAGRAEVEL